MGGRTVFIRFGVLGDSLVGASGQLIGQILRRQQGRWWLDSQQVVCLCTPACTGAYSVQFAQYVHPVHKCVHQVHSVYTRCTSVYSVHRVYSGCKWLATSGLLPHPHTHAAKWMLAVGKVARLQTPYRHPILDTRISCSSSSVTLRVPPSILQRA